MGVINEVDFRSSMKGLLKRIEQKTTDINNIFDGIIDKAKIDFADAEKMLVARALNTLDEKLQEYKDKDWSYDKIKGSWGISIYFGCGGWEEFKKYSEFINGDNKALNEHLSNSFRKYGLKHGGITTDRSGNAEFSYRITKSWCPGIGGEGFFIDEEKEDKK